VRFSRASVHGRCEINPDTTPGGRRTLPQLVGALAAGNAVLLKPSEVSATTSAVLKRLSDRYGALPGPTRATGSPLTCAFPRCPTSRALSYFDPDTVACLEGGPAVSQAILKQRFDKIFYTGSYLGHQLMRY